MPSRRLTPDEATIANLILAKTKALIEEAAGGDPVRLFAIRRRVYKHLTYWERGTPAERMKLKKARWKEQTGLCSICGVPVEQKDSELDRADPVLGYTVENVRLVHHACHRADQVAKGFV